MIGLSDCPATENDWCVRRHRLSVVQDHDGPCPSHTCVCVCVCEFVYVRTSVCVVSVSLCLQACVSVTCLWLDPMRVGASDWCHVSLCKKCLAYSCWVWFGTDGTSLPLLINQTLCNLEKLSVMPVHLSSYALYVFSFYERHTHNNLHMSAQF